MQNKRAGVSIDQLGGALIFLFFIVFGFIIFSSCSAIGDIKEDESFRKVMNAYEAEKALQEFLSFEYGGKTVRDITIFGYKDKNYRDITMVAENYFTKRYVGWDLVLFDKAGNPLVQMVHSTNSNSKSDAKTKIFFPDESGDLYFIEVFLVIG